jgi:hypothetical protein
MKLQGYIIRSRRTIWYVGSAIAECGGGSTVPSHLILLLVQLCLTYVTGLGLKLAF